MVAPYRELLRLAPKATIFTRVMLEVGGGWVVGQSKGMNMLTQLGPQDANKAHTQDKLYLKTLYKKFWR